MPLSQVWAFPIILTDEFDRWQKDFDELEGDFDSFRRYFDENRRCLCDIEECSHFEKALIDVLGDRSNELFYQRLNMGMRSFYQDNEG